MIAFLAASILALAPLPSHCAFEQAGANYAGSCGRLFDQRPAMRLHRVRALSSGSWRSDMHPLSMWAGDMTDSGYANAKLELEVYGGGWGVLRTEYGWFNVTHFTSGRTMRFDVDASKEIPPDALDVQIVRRAMAILSTPAHWNRADDRACPAPATLWSVYCAMEKATIDVTGGFHHRRPALEVVRELVDERSAGRNYHHRLMDYNNDATTQLRDVQSLFRDALRRMGAPV